MTKIFNLTNLTLLVALSLSTIAAYYSIIGLTAIFAGAVIPIIVMGSILEIGKITTTVWLRKYWSEASFILKLYLVPAVVALAMLTSMGIFGFLSKAHVDSGLVSGDVQAKLALYDEKIKTEKDNIDTARKALQQMDSQVDQLLSRGTTEQNAERAVAIRRQQAKERGNLQSDIAKAQAAIAKLNEERAPIAAENRKVEAEVGPIKYIAALIYGDNPDANILESAVRWVIILLVAVFDPLAIALVLAANASKEWDKSTPNDLPKDKVEPVNDDVAAMSIVPPEEEDTRPFTQEEIEVLDKEVVETKTDEYDLSKHPYLFKKGGWFKSGKPVVYKPEETFTDKPEEVVEEVRNEIIDTPVVEEIKEEPVTEEQPAQEISEEELNSTKELIHKNKTQLKEVEGGYIIYDGKLISKEALKQLKPELFRLTADSISPSSTSFGITFPKTANKGDIFVRVDMLPNRVFKFDGSRWFEVNRENVDSYLYDEKYVQFLISKIETGEYDIDLLSEKERSQIESYLKTNNK